MTQAELRALAEHYAPRAVGAVPLYHRGGPQACGQLSHLQLKPRAIRRDDFPADNVLVAWRDEDGMLVALPPERGQWVRCGYCRRTVDLEWLSA